MLGIDAATDRVQLNRTNNAADLESPLIFFPLTLTWRGSLRTTRFSRSMLECSVPSFFVGCQSRRSLFDKTFRYAKSCRVGAVR